MEIKRKLIVLVTMLFCVTACTDDETTVEEAIKSTSDTEITIDLSRGDYACYEMDTSFGDVILAIDEMYAPISAANFDNYSKSGFYDNIIFHNVVENYTLQTGAVSTELEKKEPNDPIINESANGLKNYRGRIAMMRGQLDPDSARSEFAIHISNNHDFDYPSLSGSGLAVIGGVVSGMTVLDKISDVQVSSREGFSYLPTENVVVNSISSTSCPVQSEAIADKITVLPYPVLQTEDISEIDLTRGDYTCYQMITSRGNIELAIDTLYAPGTSANFSEYVSDGFYDGLLMHRVIEDFVIQGGGVQTDMTLKETNYPIRSEALNGLRNFRGRLAMARTSAPHSATSQFFINVVDNHGLNRDEYSDGWGYTVFGGVIAGMDIVDQIAAVDVDTVQGWQNTPITPVTIDSITPFSCSTE